MGNNKITTYKMHRLLLDMTQQQVAEKCNVSTQMISLIETGKVIPNLQLMNNISKILQIKKLEEASDICLKASDNIM